MSLRGKITGWLLALAMAAAGAWLFRSAREPVFQGRPISVWLDAVRTGLPVKAVPGYPMPQQVPANQARQAVAAIGPAALPYIAEASAGETSLLNKLYWRIYLHSPGPVIRRLPRPPARGHPFGASVTASLFYAATKNADAGAIPTLRSLANAPRPDVRRAAIICLIRLAPQDSKAALPTIREALHDEDPSARFFAFKYLCRIADAEPSARRALAAFLHATGTNAPEWMQKEGAAALGEGRANGPVERSQPGPAAAR